MHTRSTSSAQPLALARFARGAEAAQGAIQHQADLLDAALSSYLATCTEYRTAGAADLPAEIYGLGRRLTELQIWVAEVGDRFSMADDPSLWTALVEIVTYASASPQNAARASLLITWLVTIPRNPGDAEVRAAVNDLTWSWATFQIQRSLALVDHASYVGGLSGVLVVAPLAIPGLLAGGFTVAALTVVDQWPRLLLALDHPDMLGSLFHHSLWVAVFAETDRERLIAIFRRIETIDRQTRAAIGAFTMPRPPEAAERPGLHPDGRLNVTAEAMFGAPGPGASPDGLIFPTVARLLNGAHSLISGWLHEQVSMAEVTPGSYVIGINGLSPENMTVAPNGLIAVAATGYGSDPQANPYYRHVRERFAAYIEQLPPNSTLHLAGHSMGGGMIFLLLSDPEMQDLLLAKGITLGSVTTLGAVRPASPADEIPPRNLRPEAARLFDDAEIRHYVDSDDALARNVGSGHAGYANVIMLDNGVIDDPVVAHISYNDESFQDLPPELQVLPFAVDPATYQLFPRVPPPPPPIEEPPVIVLAA